MIKLFRFFNLLSLDTAFGSIAIASFVSHVSGHYIEWPVYLALFISVLAIYNFDHLIDALMLNEDASTFRHSFYQTHFTALIVWQGVLFLSGGIVVFLLPNQVIFAGIGMMILMGLYFWLILRALKNNLVYREIFVAFGYTMAVSIVPISAIDNFTLKLLWTVLIIFLIALSNLWVLAIYELDIDKKELRHSIARSVEKSKLLNLTRVLIFLVMAAIIGYSIYFDLWLEGSLLLLVQVTYFTLLEGKQWFKSEERFRLIGEAILILPGLAYILNAGV